MQILKLKKLSFFLRIAISVLTIEDDENRKREERKIENKSLKAYYVLQQKKLTHFVQTHTFFLSHFLF